MSLINEALKKAQRRQSTDPAGGDATSASGGQPIAKRGKIQSAQTIVLLACGGLLLVVLSVVVTVWLLNRPASEAQPAQAATPPPAAPASASPGTVATAPAPTMPPAEKPAAPTPSSPAPTPASAAPTAGNPAASAASASASPASTVVASAPAATAPKAPASPLASATPPPAIPAPAAATPSPLATAAATPAHATDSPLHGTPPRQDERALAFLDAVRIGGVRAAGADSRVLMNERVYRINDIVERNTGLRLTKVASDSLSFVDAQGVTYERSF